MDLLDRLYNAADEMKQASQGIQQLIDDCLRNTLESNGPTPIPDTRLKQELNIIRIHLQLALDEVNLISGEGHENHLI
jgi:hypothetical protein